MSWIPYSFVSMYSAFVNASHLGPFMSTLPSMLAKSSIVWPTMFYMFSNKIIRRIMGEMCKFNFKFNYSEHVVSSECFF